MKSLINPALAASKTARNKRQPALDLDDPVAAARAMAIIQRSAQKKAKKASAQERLIAKAISDTTPDLIAAMDDEALAMYFFGLERVATSANRRRIALHPLRPEIVDDMHAEADKEEAGAVEKAARAEKAARENDASAEQGRDKAAAAGGEKAGPDADTAEGRA